jgi:hypothetical protein
MNYPNNDFENAVLAWENQLKAQGRMPLSNGQTLSGMSPVSQFGTSQPLRQRAQQQFNNAQQSLDDWGTQRYVANRQAFSLGDDLVDASLSPSNALKTGLTTAKTTFNPMSAAGKAALTGGLLSGGFETVASLADGRGIGESLARGAGSATTTAAGTAAGTAIGSALSPLVMAIPIPGVNVAVAGALPYVGGFLGGLWGSDKGADVGGGIYNAITGKSDPEENRLNELSQYAQFLGDGEKQALANYLALNDAQSQIDQRNALFTNDLAVDQMQRMGDINLKNDMTMNALNARIEAELQDRNNRYQMASQNSQNIWNGLGQAQDFAARIYGS